MDISIFGLGYVGAVSAACLAADQHRVIGVDPNVTKVALINQGQTPIIEQDIGDMIASAVERGLLRATTEARAAGSAAAAGAPAVACALVMNRRRPVSY